MSITVIDHAFTGLLDSPSGLNIVIPSIFNITWNPNALPREGENTSISLQLRNRNVTDIITLDIALNVTNSGFHLWDTGANTTYGIYPLNFIAIVQHWISQESEGYNVGASALLSFTNQAVRGVALRDAGSTIIFSSPTTGSVSTTSVIATTSQGSTPTANGNPSRSTSSSASLSSTTSMTDLPNTDTRTGSSATSFSQSSQLPSSTPLPHAPVVSSPKSTISKGALAGAVIGGVITLAIIAVILLYCRRTRRKKMSTHDMSVPPSAAIGHTKPENTSGKESESTMGSARWRHDRGPRYLVAEQEHSEPMAKDLHLKRLVPTYETTAVNSSSTLEP